MALTKLSLFTRPNLSKLRCFFKFPNKKILRLFKKMFLLRICLSTPMNIFAPSPYVMDVYFYNYLFQVYSH